MWFPLSPSAVRKSYVGGNGGPWEKTGPLSLDNCSGSLGAKASGKLGPSEGGKDEGRGLLLKKMQPVTVGAAH